MVRLVLRSLSLLCLLGCLAPARAGSFAELFGRAMQARAADDSVGYHALLLEAHAIEPGHPIVQIHLARAAAWIGATDEAFDWIERALVQGAWIDVEHEPALTALHEAPRWPALVARARSVGAPRGASEIGFELDDHDLLPEGIAYDPRDGAFFLTSLRERKIVRRGRDGGVTDFVGSAQDGFLAGLGIWVDARSRRLWAVANADEQVAAFSDDEKGTTGLWCWSLDDGSLVGRWMAPEDGVRHGFNDLTVLDDGRVVVTDARGGDLFVLSGAGGDLVSWLGAGSLRGPNGIAPTPDGKHVIVAEYAYGLTRVDLDARRATRLERPEHVTLVGVDGLEFHDGAYFAVQNYAGLDRAVRLEVNDDASAVTSCEVLVARHPRMDDPTTCVIAEGALWFVANSHIARFDRSRPVPGVEEWTPVLVLRVALGD